MRLFAIDSGWRWKFTKPVSLSVHRRWTVLFALAIELFAWQIGEKGWTSQILEMVSVFLAVCGLGQQQWLKFLYNFIFPANVQHRSKERKGRLSWCNALIQSPRRHVVHENWKMHPTSFSALWWPRHRHLTEQERHCWHGSADNERQRPWIFTNELSHLLADPISFANKLLNPLLACVSLQASIISVIFEPSLAELT